MKKEALWRRLPVKRIIVWALVTCMGFIMIHLISYFINRQFWLTYKNEQWYLMIKEPITDEDPPYSTEEWSDSAKFDSVKDLQRTLIRGTASPRVENSIRWLSGKNASVKLLNVFQLDGIQFPKQTEVKRLEIVILKSVKNRFVVFRMDDLATADISYDLLDLTLYTEYQYDQVLEELKLIPFSEYTMQAYEMGDSDSAGTVIKNLSDEQKQIHYTIQDGDHTYFVKETYGEPSDYMTRDNSIPMQTDILYRNTAYNFFFKVRVVRFAKLSPDWITSFRYEPSFWEKLFS